MRRLGKAYLAWAATLPVVAILLAVVDRFVPPPAVESFSGDLASIPYYARQPWTARFVEDQDHIGSAKVEYEPFTVWRRPPYVSETVNVGADRLRVVPGADCSPGARRIWFLGGSAMWGTNDPDWGTIPAAFITEMKKRTAEPLCVRNFGESAWVSTQEVIALERALQRGEKPDLAVFYDGSNDLLMTWENGEPWGHADLDRIAMGFDRAGRGRGERRKPRRSVRDLLRWVAPNLGARVDDTWPEKPYHPSRPALTPDEVARQAVGVVHVNREIARALAQRFGFDVHFFWPPTLAGGHKPLAPKEKAMVGRMRPGFVRSVELANALAGSDSTADTTDLSAVFEGTSDQLYTDPAHVSPQANEIVARAIAEVVARRLASPVLPGGVAATSR